MLNQTRIRLICLITVLIGMMCFALIAAMDGFLAPSHNDKNQSKNKPFNTSSVDSPLTKVHSHSPALQDGHMEKRHNDIYFLSKNDYHDLILALSHLYLQAHGHTVTFDDAANTHSSSLINGYILPDNVPLELLREKPKTLKLYSEMLMEKKYWDHYQHEKYKHVLDSNLEPKISQINHLSLNHEGNIQYFIELDNQLKLHRRLIRDVRLFHAEVQYQNEQLNRNDHYQLFDLKYRLNPFARETGIADAMQQAMSALVAGVYQKEAIEVLDRLGAELTRPVHKIYDGEMDAGQYPSPATFNYDLYLKLGHRLIRYADALSTQTMVDLSPAIHMELDYFKRRLAYNFIDLHSIIKNQNIQLNHLDFSELEQYISDR